MAKYVVRPELIDALIMAESGGNPRAVSPKGAKGLFQIMPRTAKQPGFGITPLQDDSPEEQRRFANDYLGAMLDKFGGNEALAVAAYNAGPGAVEKHGDIPPFRETQGYVAKIGRMLNPISSAQAADDMPVVTPESPMQPAADDLDKLWEQAQQAQPAQPEPQADPLDQLWEQAQETQPEQPKDEGYALPNFLSGAGSATLKQAGAALQMPANLLRKSGSPVSLLYDIASNKLLDESKKGEDDAPGAMGKAGRLFGDTLPFMMLPEAKYGPGIVKNIWPWASNALEQSTAAFLLTPGSKEDRDIAGAGALVGSALFPLVTGAASKAIKGFTPSTEAKALMDKGIVPTVGEGIDQSGIIGKTIRKTEEAAASIPLLGSAIRNARERSANEWAVNALQQAEVPRLGIVAGGQKGQAGIAALREGFNKAYDKQLLGQTVPVNRQLTNTMHRLVTDPANGIDITAQQLIRKNISSRLSALARNGQASANDFRKMTTSLFNEANRFIKSPDPMQQNIGRVYRNAAFQLIDHRNNHLPQNVVNNLKEIDKHYGVFSTLRDASASVGAAKNYGEFTGSQLMRAVRANDKSYRKNDFSQGEALLQDYAAAAQRVLGDTLPESGTAPRLITGSLIGGLGAYSAPGSIPTYLTATALGSLGSLRPAQKALLGGYKWQHGLSNVIDKYLTPRMAPGGAGLGYYLYDQSR